MMDATPRTTFCNPPERGRGDAVRHPKNGKRRQPAWNLGSAAPCKNAEALRLKTDNFIKIITYSLGGTDMETRDILKNLREKNKLTKSHLNGTTK
jgi:hypothetical protein